MSLQARTQGLGLTVDDALRGALALGLLEIEGVVLGPLPAGFDQERDQVTARLSARFAGKPTTDVPGVTEARTLFHQLDLDPTKTRPSSEALLRRVLQGKGLPQVNAAVDVCNLCSLEDQIPLGLYDRDLVRGPLRIRLGTEGEGYPGIRKQRVNLSGRLLLADDDGPFGAPTSDSMRSAVTARSRNLLVVLFCPLERAGTDLTAALERIAVRLTRFCSATVAAVRVIR
jgi:DNA/RNA-binding domain of Phe-tRNA-synthetase-like protein